jgi:hypothetical protein
MSGQHHSLLPTFSEQQDTISSVSPPAAQDCFALGDISKASESKVSSTQNSIGWGHDEAAPTNLQTLRSQDESKITICRLSRSKTDPYQDHTKAPGSQHRISRRLVDALEDLEIHLPVLTDKELRSLDKEWHPSTQLRKLLVKGLLRWLVAAMLVSVIYCVLYSFHKKPVMDDRSKKVSNLYISNTGI